MIEDDFGFTFHEDKEQPDVYQRIVYVDKKGKELYDLIFPFLDKLRTSEGDIIKWPQQTRSFQITKMISKMRYILNNNELPKDEIRKMTEDEIKFEKEMGIMKI